MSDKCNCDQSLVLQKLVSELIAKLDQADDLLEHVCGKIDEIECPNCGFEDLIDKAREIVQ